MVDLLGMFRRRPAKRGPPGFARSREDITALGDSMGDMLTSPVRDAPPIARDAGAGPRLPPALEAPQAEPAPPAKNRARHREDQWRRRAAAGDAGRLPGRA